MRGMVGITSLAAAALLASTALATQPKMQLSQIVDKADIGFAGKVKSQREEVVTLQEHQVAFTHVTFAVQKLIFQRDAVVIDDEITLTFAGGHLPDGSEFRVSDVPTFKNDEEVVIFAFYDGTRYADPIVGGSQGLLKVIHDRSTQAAYPLANGGRGIEQVEKGNLVTTDFVNAIDGGAITWGSANPAEAGAIDASGIAMPAPTGSSPQQTATVSTLTQPNRPASVLDLDAFAKAVVDVKKAHPRAGR